MQQEAFEACHLQLLLLTILRLVLLVRSLVPAEQATAPSASSKTPPRTTPTAPFSMAHNWDIGVAAQPRAWAAEAQRFYRQGRSPGAHLLRLGIERLPPLADQPLDVFVRRLRVVALDLCGRSLPPSRATPTRATVGSA